MAVVTIDAKGELAELQAMQDIPGVPTPARAPAAEPLKPADGPAPAKEPPTEDPDDVEGEDGLTPRQKREFTQAMQRTIGKKHRERREAEEFAAAQYNERKLAEARAAAAEAEVERLRAAAPAKPETQPDPEAGKPTRDKFDSDQAYWDAHIDWRAKREAAKMLAEARAEDARAAAERRTAEILETAKSRIGKAIELISDYQAVVGAVDLEVPPVVAGYMQKSPMFAELGYHLAKNPDVLRSISKLPADEQLVTIGKIEGTLKPFEPQGSKAAQTTNGATPSKTEAASAAHAAESETGSTPSRARSSAPVITPLNGNSGAAVQKDPSEMNIRETITAWQTRNRANLGLRKRH